MKLTPEIIKALKAAIEGLGSASELSRKSGVNHRSISQYLSPKINIRNIELETWLKLEPFLRPYMSTESTSGMDVTNSSVLTKLERKIIVFVKKLTEDQQLDVLELLAANFGGMVHDKNPRHEHDTRSAG